MIKFCRRCFYHNHHPLNLTFDEEGICSGCRVHEEKDLIDWHDKLNDLKNLVEPYKSLSGSNYDCIVPVSGARDSFFIVHVVKNILKLNPLLVTYNKHYNTNIGWQNIAQLRTVFNCDLSTLTVSPATVKEITRSTLRMFGSIYWHCLAGQTVYPVQTAVKLKIPLIIWGAHQGVDQVGMFSHFHNVEMTRKYRKEHDLLGFEAEDLINDIDNLTEASVFQYFYPDNYEISAVGVRGIYLNNYIRWDSRLQHERMISQYGYKTFPQNRTFDTYNDVDCWNYSDLHDYIKYLKHGYSKVVDHAVRELRLRHLSRDQGIALISQYIYKHPIFNALFLEWLSVTPQAFNYIINQHRGSAHWHQSDDWLWRPKYNLINSLKSVSNPDLLSPNECFKSFTITAHAKSSDRDDAYVLIGKGV